MFISFSVSQQYRISLLWMASFVSTSSDEEQVVEIGKYLNKLQTKGKEPNETFSQEIVKLFQEKKEAEALSKILDESGLVFTEGVEKGKESHLCIDLFL